MGNCTSESGTDGEGVGDGNGAGVGDGVGGGCGGIPRAMTESPGNCTWETYCGHGYWFCLNNQDWLDARVSCQTIGGDLVAINDAQEQAFVSTHATGNDDWLIGLNRINASGMNALGQWEWVDGTLVADDDENWRGSGPGTFDCGSLDTGGWEDYSCANGEDWICEVP